MTVKTIPVQGHRPEQPTERPKGPAPPPPPCGRGANRYEDLLLARIRHLEERCESYAALIGTATGTAKCALGQLERGDVERAATSMAVLAHLECPR